MSRGNVIYPFTDRKFSSALQANLTLPWTYVLQPTRI